MRKLIALRNKAKQYGINASLRTLLSMRATADEFGMSEATASRLIKKGVLQPDGVTTNGAYLFDKERIDREAPIVRALKHRIDL